METRDSGTEEHVHSFIVHCLNLTEYKINKALQSCASTHGDMELAADSTDTVYGVLRCFYKVQNKGLFFKQVTLVYFIHYTFSCRKKNKIVQLHKYKILPP